MRSHNPEPDVAQAGHAVGAAAGGGGNLTGQYAHMAQHPSHPGGGVPAATSAPPDSFLEGTTLDAPTLRASVAVSYINLAIMCASTLVTLVLPHTAEVALDLRQLRQLKPLMLEGTLETMKLVWIILISMTLLCAAAVECVYRMTVVAEHHRETMRLLRDNCIATTVQVAFAFVVYAIEISPSFELPGTGVLSNINGLVLIPAIAQSCALLWALAGLTGPRRLLWLLYTVMGPWSTFYIKGGFAGAVRTAMPAAAVPLWAGGFVWAVWSRYRAGRHAPHQYRHGQLDRTENTLSVSPDARAATGTTSSRAWTAASLSKQRARPAPATSAPAEVVSSTHAQTDDAPSATTPQFQLASSRAPAGMHTHSSVTPASTRLRLFVVAAACFVLVAVSGVAYAVAGSGGGLWGRTGVVMSFALMRGPVAYMVIVAVIMLATGSSHHARLHWELQQAAELRVVNQRKFMRYVFHEVRVPLNTMALALDTATSFPPTAATTACTAAASTVLGSSSSSPPPSSSSVAGDVGAARYVDDAECASGVAGDVKTTDHSSDCCVDATALAQLAAVRHDGVVRATTVADEVKRVACVTDSTAERASTLGSSLPKRGDAVAGEVETVCQRNRTVLVLDEEAADAFRTALEGMVNVLNDVLTLEKIEAGAFTFEQHRLDVQRVAREVQRLFAPSCAANGLLFEVELRGATDTPLIGDESRLKQVIANYVSNAIKFTPMSGKVRVVVSVGHSSRPGSVQASLGGPAVCPIVHGRPLAHTLTESSAATTTSDTLGQTISTAPSAALPIPSLPTAPRARVPTPWHRQAAPRPVPTTASLCVEVHDTGIGFTHRERDDVLFKPFQQVRASLQQGGKGTGLGLSICRVLIEGMGGDVGAHSSGPGQGSVFWFRLPVPVCDEDASVHEDELGRSRSVSSTIGNVSSALLSSGEEHGSPRGMNGGDDVVVVVTAGQVDDAVSTDARSRRSEGVVQIDRQDRQDGGGGTGEGGGAAGQREPSRKGAAAAGSTAHSTTASAAIDTQELATMPSMATSSHHHDRPRDATTLLRNLRLLLVDDSQVACRMLARVVSSLGAQGVALAFNGAEGLERVRERVEVAGSLVQQLQQQQAQQQPLQQQASAAREHPFDVIITDLDMPVMDGLTMTQRLRARGFTGIIIGASGHALEEDRRAMLGGGMDAVLPKPVRKSDLVDLLSRMLGPGGQVNSTAARRLLQMKTPGPASKYMLG